ncbi:hypothetical protein [Nitrosarchaeum sp.]|nr:hypothetical protein [Nitrosarchaeum sp.]
MKYNCKDCKFHWEGWIDTFEHVLTHEKTHLKNKKTMEATS